MLSKECKQKQFTLLTKHEPALKKRFNWVIDESKCLNLSQVKKLRQHCKEITLEDPRQFIVRDWFMVEIGLFTGLRVSEMADLKISDLHIENNQSSLTVRNGKGGKTRIVCFGSEFKQNCIFFLSGTKPAEKDSFLLTGKFGNKLTKRALQKAFKRCLRGAGLNARHGIHCLRHTFGSHLYRASKYNLRLVQQQLGHSSIRTTQVYANLFDEDVKKAVEKIYG